MSDVGWSRGPARECYLREMDGRANRSYRIRTDRDDVVSFVCGFSKSLSHDPKSQRQTSGYCRVAVVKEKSKKVAPSPHGTLNLDSSRFGECLTSLNA